MLIQDLYIYPVKSLAGIRLSGSKVSTTGLTYDRQWMLVDNRGKFLSQRAYPEMALFKTSIIGNSLEIVHATHGGLSINMNVQTQAKLKVEIWDDYCSGLQVSKIADEYFSEILGQKVQLVQMPEQSDRPTDPRYAEGHHVRYADGYPFLLISQASLDNLNAKLDDAVPMDRFRPNIVVSETGAFWEDDVRKVRMGTCEFEVVKPCARCVVTTIDQETAIKNKEPLKTLSKYRNFNGKVIFGQNMVCTKLGSINIGDKVEVLSWKQ